MVTKSTNVDYIDDQSDPRVAQRVRSKRPDEGTAHQHRGGAKRAETWWGA